MTELGPEFLYSSAGYLGVAVYLSAYVALQMGAIPGVGYAYASLNMIAALLVLVSLMQSFNMASAIIQLSWVVISLFGIIRIYLITRRLVFTEEELCVLEHGLPGTPRQIARRILDAGYWVDELPGFRLLEEGEPVKQLFFLAKGAADVTVGGKLVAAMEQGFIGEMNVMSEGPASATVQVSKPSRFFCVSGQNLRSIARKNSEADIYIEKHLSAATKRKLVRANMQISKSA